MSEDLLINKDRDPPKKLLILTLIASYFAVLTPLTLTRLFLVDIGDTFGQPVGITGQITTIASLVTVLSAVLGGAWSVRFKHKSLLQLGLIFSSISAIGCFFASNFYMMLITYAISGLGLGMVEPMLYTMVGAHYPLEKRPQAFGWLLIGAVLAFFNAPIMGFIAENGNWQIVFLSFVFPSVFLSLIVTIKGIPAPPESSDPKSNNVKYWDGFKEISTRFSALACLTGSVLAMSAWQAIALYSIAYFREQFLISIKFGSWIILGTALSYLVGSQISSRVIKQIGMKPVTVLTIFFGSIFIIAFMNVSHLRLAILFIFLSCLCFRMRATAASSLTLEQVPRFRGSMMSMNSAAWFLGFALGALIGGATLLRFNYEMLGIVLGATGFAAALFFLIVTDPTKSPSTTIV